jgi:diphthamide synthase (EF-2-diphthine--ammonia ligase)
MESFGYTTAEERKEQVKKLHARGCHQTVISDILEASRSTIRRDCHELGLGTWSPLPDADLRKHILDIIEIEHTAAGQRKVESHLVSRGFRIQKRRIRESLVRFYEPQTLKGVCSLYISP